MPAKSKNQQQAAGMALAAKRGEMPKSELKGAAKDMYESMTKKELKEYAETDRKGLPEKKKEAMLRGFQYEIEKNAGVGSALLRGAKYLSGKSKLLGGKLGKRIQRQGILQQQKARKIHGLFGGKRSLRGRIGGELRGLGKGIRKYPGAPGVVAGGLGAAGLTGYTLGKGSNRRRRR